MAPPPGLDQLRTRLAILGFWLALGLLESGKELAAGRLEGNTIPLDRVLIVNFPWWFLWAFGSLAVIAVARRVPLEGGRPIRAFLVHIFAAVTLAVVHLGLVGTLTHFAVSRGGPYALNTLPEQVRYWLQAYGVMHVFMYFMVLGAYHALLYHRRYTEGRVREAEARARASASEAAASEARLEALRMELNPHFLFNALNAVAGLVDDGRDREATTMLARLAALLRHTLEGGRQREVPLERELEMLERYLDIERVRFGDRLSAGIVADSDVSDAAVPPMILQPLVENAMRHGVARTRGPAQVEIEAVREGGSLRVRVVDNGPGPAISGASGLNGQGGEGSAGQTIPDETISDDDGTRGGTGLSNVRGRLQALYGDAAGLTLAAGPRGGCVTELRLPYRVIETRVPA